MLRTLASGARDEITSAPSSTPELIGDICTPPDRLCVVSTARWCVAAKARVSEISMPPVWPTPTDRWITRVSHGYDAALARARGKRRTLFCLLSGAGETCAVATGLIRYVTTWQVQGDRPQSRQAAVARDAALRGLRCRRCDARAARRASSMSVSLRIRASSIRMWGCMTTDPIWGMWSTVA